MAAITKRSLKSIDHEIDSLKIRMDVLRKDYKILDYESQAKRSHPGHGACVGRSKEEYSRRKKNYRNG